MSRPAYIEEGAIASGWTAYAAARLLRRHWREAVEDLPPHLREPLEDYLQALDRAARRWQDRRRGSAEAVAAEAVTDSIQELTTTEVSTILDVSTRRARQLAEAGILPGKQKKRGAPWRFDRGAVIAYQESRGNK